MLIILIIELDLPNTFKRVLLGEILELLLPLILTYVYDFVDLLLNRFNFIAHAARCVDEDCHSRRISQIEERREIEIADVATNLADVMTSRLEPML